MGHHRLGRLPKTQRWREVVDLLSVSPGDIQAISRAVLRAAEERLRALAHDESLTYSFWLLTRITWAARQDDFAGTLSEIGLDVAEDTSSLVFISSVADRLRSRSQSTHSRGRSPSWPPSPCAGPLPKPLASAAQVSSTARWRTSG
jgi:hypothetical protein